ncbi:TonB family protein [Pontivivens sp. MT2928]|uniref:TonB family protein n=1 Tax=Pontivivens ytuae TaxID=2789856 RepID=A0A7S9LUZ1_9RHOB|nr:TonB family protein [Pontivivens ytuae]
MIRYVEAAFCLVLALLIHLAFWIGQPEEGALGGAGNGGTEALSMQASSESFAAMVEHWDRPVEVGQTIEMRQPETPQAPLADLPSIAAAPTEMRPLETMERQEIDVAPETPRTAAPAELSVDPPRTEGITLPTDTIDRPQQDRRQALASPRPMSDAAAVATPEVDTTPAEPAATEAAISRSSPPRARPREIEPAPPAPQQPAVASTEPNRSNEPVSEARPDTTAAGTGGAEVAGNAGPSSAPSMSPADRSSLVAEWGAQIVADLNRRSVRARGRRGTVLLDLTIARDGTVLAARVSQSSGNARLDEASLAVIQQGAVPPAPSSLQLAQQRFSVPLRIQ